MITFDSENIHLPNLDYDRIRKWILQVAGSYNRIVGDINYLFVDDEKILQVNREFLQHDYYTDIITFDRSRRRMIAGDIVLSLDTVRSNAELVGSAYLDELHRVIIHGILHLCGINDKGPGERAIMEANENKALVLFDNLK